MPAKSIIELNRATGDMPIVIHFQLVEQTGEKVDLLIQDVESLSMRYILDKAVTVVDIHQLAGSETSITFGFALEEVTDPKLGIKFLESVFKQFFDKHPTFIEPPAV